MLDKELAILNDVCRAVLQRRAISRAFLGLLKMHEGDEVENNEFALYYSSDYLKSQLVDLRLLFDRSDDSLSVKRVIEHLNNPSLSKLHSELYSEWNVVSGSGISLGDVANKVFAHRVLATEHRHTILTLHLDGFINKTAEFLWLIFSEAKKNGHQFEFDEMGFSASYLQTQRKSLNEIIEILNQSRLKIL